jgi:TATA-binding protein-associated factor Taf7
VTTYKSSDVAQILVVYEDEEARDRAEADARPRKDGDPFLGHPSGLTPPTHNVTKRRFAKTKGKLESVPRAEVEAVEQELMALFETTGRASAASSAAAAGTLAVGDVELPAGSVVLGDDDQVVDFEEYMWCGPHSRNANR